MQYLKNILVREVHPQNIYAKILLKPKKYKTIKMLKIIKKY